MAIQITGTFEPTGDFPLAKAKDVEMPNGTRLSDFEIPEGKDGVSPVIVITKIDGGHTITIKDASGTHSFNVMDGKDGKDGEDGQGTSITVDSALDANSENPVQNKVITEQLDMAMELLQTGILPNLLPEVNEADNGKVPVVVNGQWVATDQPGGGSITVDSELSETSENPVQNKVLTAVINEAMMVMEQLMAAIPTDAHINSLIDAYIGEALGGEY